MVTPELLQYIQQRLGQGAGQDEIRKELQEQGWQNADIDEAFTGKPQDVSSQMGSYLGASPQKNSLLTYLKYIQFKYFGSRGFLPFLLIIPIIIIAVVGYSIYFSPQQQLKRMAEKMTDTTTLSYKGSADISFTMPESSSTAPSLGFSEPVTVAVQFEGKSNFKDPLKPASSTVLDIDANASIINIKAKIESLTVEGQSFIKLLQLPDLGFIDFTPILNQWMILEDPDEETIPYELSDSERKKLMDKIEKGDILKITKSLGSKKINNVSTDGFRYEISKAELTALAQEYKSIVQDKVTEEEIQSIDELVEAIQEIESITGELWIGKWDSYLYKVVLNLKTEENTDQPKVDLSTEVELSGHNKQVIISKPSSYKTQDELMRDLYPSSPYPPNSPSPLLQSESMQSAPSVTGTPMPLFDSLIQTIQ